MTGIVDSVRIMLGGNPRRHGKQEYSKEARDMHAFKQTPEQRKERVAAIREELAHKQTSYRIRKWRWTSIVLINLLFVVSYWFDVQLVEGALTASRFVGFHMADLNAALQVVLAYKIILINLVIGVVTVALLWWLVGGRSFWRLGLPLSLAGRICRNDSHAARGKTRYQRAAIASLNANSALCDLRRLGFCDRIYCF